VEPTCLKPGTDELVGQQVFAGEAAWPTPEAATPSWTSASPTGPVPLSLLGRVP
jgi:hypothetical protein